MSMGLHGKKVNKGTNRCRPKRKFRKPCKCKTPQRPQVLEPVDENQSWGYGREKNRTDGGIGGQMVGRTDGHSSGYSGSHGRSEGYSGGRSGNHGRSGGFGGLRL